MIANPIHRTILAAMVAGLWSSIAVAVPMAWTSKTGFTSPLGIGAPSVSLDFDSLTAGTLLPSGTTFPIAPIHGPTVATLEYSIPGCAPADCVMKVADQFKTTSGSQYLGLDDSPNFDQFIAGDRFGFRFPSDAEVRAFGFTLISSDPIGVPGGISLTAEFGSEVSTIDSIYGAAIDSSQTAMADGGYLYFIGISDTSTSSPITRVNIEFSEQLQGTFLYAVDDVLIKQTTQVPAPGTLPLVLIPAAGLVLVSRFRKKIH